MNTCGTGVLTGQGGCTPSTTSVAIWYLDAQNDLVTGTRTTTRTCNPDTVTTTYTDVTGAFMLQPSEVKVSYVVPSLPSEPTPVEIFQDPGTSINVTVVNQRDREMVTMCVPETNIKVVIQYDVLTTPPTVLSVWNLSQDAPYPGPISDLVSCVEEKLDYGSPISYCSGGADFTRTDVFNAISLSVVGAIWQDAAGTVVPAPATPTLGACSLAVNSAAQLAALQAIASGLPLIVDGENGPNGLIYQSVVGGWVDTSSPGVNGGGIQPAAIVYWYKPKDNSFAAMYARIPDGTASPALFALTPGTWGFGAIPPVVVNTPGSLEVTGTAVTSVPQASVKSITLIPKTDGVGYSTDNGASYAPITTGSRTWSAQKGAALNVASMRFQGLLITSKYDIVFEF